MRLARPLIIAVLLAGTRVAGAESPGCNIQTLGELSVTMEGMEPVVTASIGTTDLPFIVDSGAFWSMISPAMARDLKLKLTRAPPWLLLRGVGGTTRPSLAHVHDFRFASYSMPDIDFLVGGNKIDNGIAGLIGQNLLRIADVDYDLANGVIRLMRPNSACSNSTLGYWAPRGPLSVVGIESTDLRNPQTIGTAFVNGVKMRVMFDTGAASSMLSRDAAERAGVPVKGPNVVFAGVTTGVGRKPMRTWIAPIEDFKIGDEEVRNTRLRLGDFGGSDVDMLLGADFFLSHHIYVANSQGRLFFTYNARPSLDPNASTSSEPAATPAENPPMEMSR